MMCIGLRLHPSYGLNRRNYRVGLHDLLGATLCN
jgi:hypothetical protein